MNLLAIYIFIFFLLFLVMPAVFAIIRVILWLIFDYCGFSRVRRNQRQNDTDRQGNSGPQANGAGRADNGYNDIFFIEPNSQEAASIRAQLEKDDKDLPSYEEVMRIAAAPAPINSIPIIPSALTMGASSSSVNTNNNILSIPTNRGADTSVRPLTPPPYTPEPIGDTVVVVPITTPLHTAQNSQSA